MEVVLVLFIIIVFGIGIFNFLFKYVSAGNSQPF